MFENAFDKERENSKESLEWLADWERFEVANRQVAAFFEE